MCSDGARLLGAQREEGREREDVGVGRCGEWCASCFRDWLAVFGPYGSNHPLFFFFPFFLLRAACSGAGEAPGFVSLVA